MPPSVLRLQEAPTCSHFSNLGFPRAAFLCFYCDEDCPPPEPAAFCCGKLGISTRLKVQMQRQDEKVPFFLACLCLSIYAPFIGAKAR
ncbi:hypothetical protein Pfo_003032 [Paulownia fortunei]|nr:hypothetical protein Pfo_003032 [Paulownia fortunei]